MERFPASRSDRRSSRTRLSVAIAASLALALSVGCDSEESQANRKLEDVLHQAQLAQYSEGDKAQAHERAHQLLVQAAGESAASPGNRALAHALVGQSSFSAAIQKLDELSTAETNVLEQISNISRVGANLSLDNASIEAFRASNPEGSGDQKPIDTIQKNKARFLSQANEVQGQIGKLTEQIRTIQQRAGEIRQQQQQAQQQAATLNDQSDAARRDGKGEESLNLFKQAADARLKAQRLGADLAHAQGEVARLEAQVAGLQQQQKTLQESAAFADQQLANLQTSWQETQKLIEERSNSLKATLGAEGVTARAKALNEAQGSADTLRKEIAETHLEQAITSFESAIKDAEQFASAIQTQSGANPADRAAFERLRQANSPARYRLDKARALQLRGTLHFRHKTLLEARDRLVDGLSALVQPANLTLPPELTGSNLDQQIKDVTAAAEKDLKEAEEILGTIAEGGGRAEASDQNAALTLRSATRFSLYHLLNQEEHLNNAKADLQMLAEKGVALPTLPATLTSGIRQGAPATPPAQPPADGATPAETPAQPATDAPAQPAQPANPQ